MRFRFIKILIPNRGAVNYQFDCFRTKETIFAIFPPFPTPINVFWPLLSAFWRSLNRSVCSIFGQILSNIHIYYIYKSNGFRSYSMLEHFCYTRILFQTNVTCFGIDTHTERVELKLILITNQQNWTNLSFTSALKFCAEIETLTFVYCCESCSAFTIK